MRIDRYIMILIGYCLLAIGCEDALDPMEPNLEGGFPEGKVAFHLQAGAPSVIQSRSVDMSEEAIENVTLLVYKETGTAGNHSDWTLQERAYQQLIDNNNLISLYLKADPSASQRIYAICNLADTSLVAREKVSTLADLEQISVEIQKPDGAYTGNYVMSGYCSIDKGPTLQSKYDIVVERLAAKLDFHINFNPAHTGDRFVVSGLFMRNIPMGSKLIAYPEGDKDTLNICPQDYGYGKTPLPYQNTRIPFETSAGVTKADYSGTFRMFENRQGGLTNEVDNWSGLKGLIGVTDGLPPNSGYADLFEYYRQISKGVKIGMGHAKDRPNASYLEIRGIYTKAGGGAYEVKYHVYLGKDNYKDYNVLRNHHYIYRIQIYDMENIDTRVHATGIDNLEIFGETEQILDAHPNALQLLLYSMNDWTMRVAEPDSTPWLEVSKSLSYVPQMANEHREDRASFRMSGKGGLQYIYIHTDEYVPNIQSPTQNKDFGVREGKIICESGEEQKVITIRQYPAQMVVCHIKYDVHTMKEVLDTFYVERVLEKKNMAWGFDHYWSFITDDLIASGQWDGLSNTRKLYDVALNGDKWGVEPAYKDGIPSNIALGYAVAKNRDRNGNGKIDYNEIVWYLPAANELLALSGHIGGGSDKYYDSHLKNTVEWQAENGNLHSSTPSVADPAGSTTGRSYFVNLASGKKSLNLRTRYLNVVCCRRANAWRGPDTGESDGNVDHNPGWDGEHEEIMPKGK